MAPEDVLKAFVLFAELESDDEVRMWAARNISDYAPVYRLLIHLARLFQKPRGDK